MVGTEKPLVECGVQPGGSVAELDVPSEFDGKKFEEFVHLLHVDVDARKLAPKRSQG